MKLEDIKSKTKASQQQEGFAAAFRGMWTSEGNSQNLAPQPQKP